ncbi:hypothetical protein M0R04_11975 [Candidatus Dojkabacteria bacterium]|jgi:hypothetical protein|nr:hypothetical protein [Candidatus Dojkabacteria bacterium]
MPNWLKNLLDHAFRFISAVLKSVFTIAFKMLMARLSDVATLSITKLAATNLSNDEKRREAFNEIKTAAIERALSFNDSDLYLIIEVFHKNLKAAGVIA